MLLYAVAAAAAVLVLVGARVAYVELRNQHHMWRSPCVTPASTRDDIRFVLREFRRASADTGLRWWLDYGTLFGAWRLGDVMAFDHDLDVSFHADDLPIVERLRASLAAHGIDLRMER